MKILQISSARRMGGGEVHVVQLARELGRRGHTVEIAGIRSGPIACDHWLSSGRRLGLGAVMRVRRIVEAGRFDVVHAHVARDYPIAATALLGDASTRLVLTRHLPSAVRWNPLYRRVDGWIATTPEIRDLLIPIGPRRIEVIPNWVDPSLFAYRERPLRAPVAVGLLGQIVPHKGHDDALGMLERLGPGYRLVLGGTGQDDYVASLKARARTLPVEFLGFVDAAKFLEEIDVLILPSWNEAFGIVLLEAMSAGVSVIATSKGGPPDILDHGRAGLLVPIHDPASLAAAVQRLVSDRELADRLRRTARARITEHFDISHVVPRVEAFYESLAAQTEIHS